MKSVLFIFALIIPIVAYSQSFTVIELFTSEGCSSCPPADNLLSELISHSPENSVIALSFHVDYWNYIGWTDPFSNADYTERQKMYAAKMRLNSIYTPQMIVNGTSEFVGSDRSKALLSIKNPNKETTKISASIKTENGKLFINYSLSEISKSSFLNVALVEKGLEKNISSGENSGRKLVHNNVVRNFMRIEINGNEKGNIEMNIPIGLIQKRSSVILYVQDEKTLGISSAKEISL